jgi:hypothetical protein
MVCLAVPAVSPEKRPAVEVKKPLKKRAGKTVSVVDDNAAI